VLGMDSKNSEGNRNKKFEGRVHDGNQTRVGVKEWGWKEGRVGT
jgi:hypothetical protein